MDRIVNLTSYKYEMLSYKYLHKQPPSNTGEILYHAKASAEPLTTDLGFVYTWVCHFNDEVVGLVAGSTADDVPINLQSDAII